MTIRPFHTDTDFNEIQNWIPDARTHALWCANRFSFPLDMDNLADTLAASGDSAFLAVREDDVPVGFFCCAHNPETNETMLKFVMISPTYRGKGSGQEMIRLAAKYAFTAYHAASVQLNVFTCNQNAIRCYRHAGFTERAVTENAFSFQDEVWGRCNMTLRNV
jgi:RimJ/RimL family protein N-acetyltransferase